jgi:hypothetical protein
MDAAVRRLVTLLSKSQRAPMKLADSVSGFRQSGERGTFSVNDVRHWKQVQMELNYGSSNG